MHKQFKHDLTLVLKIFLCRLLTWNSTTISFNVTSTANFSDSDNVHYKAELARKCTEIEALLREQEEKEYFNYQAWREAKLAKQRKLEEEACKKAKEEELWRKAEEEEAWRIAEKCQKDLAHHLEADCIAAIEQQQCKNWAKIFLLPPSPPSDEEMNLLDFPPLTNRQCVHYLPKETPEARQWCKELVREMEMSVVGRGNPYERCTDFGILCILQNLLWVFI